MRKSEELNRMPRRESLLGLLEMSTMVLPVNESLAPLLGRRRRRRQDAD